MAAVGVHWVQFFHGVKLQNGYMLLENLTKASIYITTTKLLEVNNAQILIRIPECTVQLTTAAGLVHKWTAPEIVRKCTETTSPSLVSFSHNRVRLPLSHLKRTAPRSKMKSGVIVRQVWNPALKQLSNLTDCWYLLIWSVLVGCLGALSPLCCLLSKCLIWTGLSVINPGYEQ